MTDPIAALNAALADHYVIERELGRGGMALVYLARDIRHERFVALKTLRPEIAVALGRERFLREIKLAARLQHPNILPVYDSGDAGGALYFVMPFVEGESLRDRLERESQLPFEEALQIAREVADALAYAHSHDVVHRDIKPENIMMSGGHAIVADFGIARAVTAAGGDKLTETGLAIGTPIYMSPEQAAGTGHVDRRSDIYSLACVLYETLAGQPPFSGPTAQAIMARHSLDAVPRLRVVRPTIPDALEQVIERALAKVPADRYQTAAQFAEAITAASTGTVSRVTLSPRLPAAGARRWRRLAVAAGIVLLAIAVWLMWWRGNGGPAPTGDLDPRRVAVLYFQDLSRDSSLGFLADGLTEALIDELGRVRSLSVISRGGVAQYRGEALPRDSIARALGAGTLVEGSVEDAGPRLRLSVRLVDGSSGTDIRRQSFELPRGNLLALRDSAAHEVARFLRGRLGEDLRLRDERAATKSVQAWTLVQQAERLRKEADARVRERKADAGLAALQRADTLLAQAEQADPFWLTPVLLRARVAQQGARALQANPRAAEPWITSGLAHARRALALAAGDAEALELVGTLRFYRYAFGMVPPKLVDVELRAAQDDLQTAVQTKPLASAYATLSRLQYQRGDLPAVVIAARRAYEEDAFLESADQVLLRLFYASYDGELHAEARQACEEGARRFPDDYSFTECQLWVMTTEARAPDVALAWRLAAKLDSMVPDDVRAFEHSQGLILVGSVIGRAGLKDSARKTLLRSREGVKGDVARELSGTEAFVRTQIGDFDEAIRLLKGYIAGDPEHLFRAGGNLHWWWRPLRDQPGFRSITGARN